MRGGISGGCRGQHGRLETRAYHRQRPRRTIGAFGTKWKPTVPLWCVLTPADIVRAAPIRSTGRMRHPSSFHHAVGFMFECSGGTPPASRRRARPAPSTHALPQLRCRQTPPITRDSLTPRPSGGRPVCWPSGRRRCSPCTRPGSCARGMPPRRRWPGAPRAHGQPLRSRKPRRCGWTPRATGPWLPNRPRRSCPPMLPPSFRP